MRNKNMKLYHAGGCEIRRPDIHFGRRNADFGEGFYLTPEVEFAYRWAGKGAVLNEYEFDESGLLIHRFTRDIDWFQYISRNRRGVDTLNADVVIGPISNDTIFDTLGILSSGYLNPEDALKLLLIGPEYTQVAVKTEKAVSHLRWLRSETISSVDTAKIARDQEDYQEAFEKQLAGMLGDS